MSSSEIITTAGMPQEFPLNAPRTARLLVLTGMLLITLTDFYFPSVGIPIVPIAGMALFVLSSTRWSVGFVAEHRIRRCNTTFIGLVLIVIYLCSVAWGLIAFRSGSAKGAIGMGLGTLLLVFVLDRGRNEEYRGLLVRFCGVLLALHLVFWIVQAAWFGVTGRFLDYVQPITGTPTRFGTGAEGMLIKLTRFTGLFVEPAIYSQFVYWAVTVRVLHNRLRLRLLDVIAMVTVAISMSISGILLMLFVLGVCAAHTLRGWRAAGAVLIGILSIIGLASALQDTDAMKILTARLTAPEADPSGRIRTVGGLEVFAGLPQLREDRRYRSRQRAVCRQLQLQLLYVYSGVFWPDRRRHCCCAVCGSCPAEQAASCDMAVHYRPVARRPDADLSGLVALDRHDEPGCSLR